MLLINCFKSKSVYVKTEVFLSFTENHNLCSPIYICTLPCIIIMVNWGCFHGDVCHCIHVSNCDSITILGNKHETKRLESSLFCFTKWWQNNFWVTLSPLSFYALQIKSHHAMHYSSLLYTAVIRFIVIPTPGKCIIDDI